jgi:hypothetical protein
VAAHLERGFKRGIGALSALLEPTVQVRGDRGQGRLRSSSPRSFGWESPPSAAVAATWSSRWVGCVMPKMTDEQLLAAENFVIELKAFRERFDKTAKVAL